MFLIGFPLLVISFAIYHMIVFLLDMQLTEAAFSFDMLSGVSLALSVGDLLVIFSILLLYVEILKATRLGYRAIIDHVLSMVLFLAMLVEFLLVARTATPTFLVLLVLSFVDVIGGFTITIRTAQRDFSVAGVDAMHGGN